MQEIKKKVFHCVGCGGSIPWDGTGLFSYTCSCGATLFADQSHRLSFPASLIMAIHEKRKIPHIDYYLGFSNYISEEKQACYEELRKLGAIWSWECSQCKERYLKRKKMQIQNNLIRMELHPELKALIP